MPRFRPDVPIDWAHVRRLHGDDDIGTEQYGGVVVRERFYSVGLEYTNGRMWDAIARMLDAVPPCCAVYPEFVSGRLNKLVVAYNKDVSVVGQRAIEAVWRKIVEVSAMSAIERQSHIPELLSMVIDMHEYKMLSYLGKFATYFISIAERIENSLDEAVDARADDDQLALAYKASRPYKKLFKLVQNFVNWSDDKKSHFDYKAESLYDSSDLQSQISIVLGLLELGGYSDGLRSCDKPKEFSHIMMKLNIIVSAVIRDGSGLLGFYTNDIKLLQESYTAFSDGFSRVMQDVCNVVKSLRDVGDVKIHFVENSARIHAELAIVQYEMMKLWYRHTEGEFVESSHTIVRHIGVSKLSCVECHALFEAMNLSKYVRGGHGRLHHDWVFPRWELEDGTFVEWVSDVIQSSLERERDKKHVYPCDIYPSKYLAGFSDDELDAPSHRQLSREKHGSAENYVRKWFGKIFELSFEDIGNKSVSDEEGINKSIDTGPSVTPEDVHVAGNLSVASD